jgi:hypothetical protein
VRWCFCNQANDYIITVPEIVGAGGLDGIGLNNTIHFSYLKYQAAKLGVDLI